MNALESTMEAPYFPKPFLKVKCLVDTRLQESVAPNNCFRLFLVKAGAGIIRINQKQLAFSSPAVFCINEQETIELASPGEVLAHEVHFHPDWLNPLFLFENLRRENFAKQGDIRDVQDQYLLRPFLDRDARYAGVFPCSPETLQGLANLHRSIDNQIQAHPDNYWPCRSRSYLIQALIMVCDLLALVNATEPVVKSPEVKPIPFQETNGINEVIAYLHNHYAEDIQIADLERQFGLNRTTLAERFKKATGQSVMSYLRSLRLRTAASLLQETWVPVSEIHDRVGFGDLSHFGRVFKEEFTLTPKEYRDQFCWIYRNN